ncbi:MAG: DUF1206 domain-containing protein [Hamadaea sp.]|nr:DUF1206 domain-containing protein [Hamadaea sp.]
MSVAEGARRQARKAAHSTVLEWPTRAGFVGYGLLHLAVAWISLQILLGRPTGDSGQSGAFETLARQPAGRLILILTTVGLVAMTVWQLLLAAIGHRSEQGWHRPAERLLSLGRAVVYVALAWTAEQVVAGTATSSAEQQRDFTAKLLGMAYGPVLVIAAGVLVVLFSLGMCVYGATKKFARRLKTAEMSDTLRKTTIRLGQIGYIGRGVAIGVVGVLVVVAGITHDPTKSGGLDTALKTLPRADAGPLLMWVVAAGFTAFGVYCFAQSRYRKV